MDETQQQRPAEPGAGGARGAGAPPPRVLRRSRTDRKVAGVAGGLARYFDVDPLLVRVAFVVLAISGAGAGLIFYLACAVLVPLEDGPDGGTLPGEAFVDRHGRTLAIVAAILAALALLGGPGPFGWGHDDGGPWVLLWIALVVTAVVLVVRELQARTERAGRATAPGWVPPGTPGSAGGPPAGGAQGAGWTTWHAAPPAGPVTTPVTGPVPPVPPVPPAPPAKTPPSPQQVAASVVAAVTVGLALTVAGLLVALDRADAVDVGATAVLAAALATVGAGAVVGGLLGRVRGLLAVGVLLALVTGVAALDPPGDGQVGEVDWRPTAVSEVAETYRWGVGEARLDLTGVADLGARTTVRTRAELGVGALTVLVPADATVVTDAHVQLGALRGIGPESGGFDREARTTLPPRDGDADDGPVIELDLRVGLGEVEVSRVG